LHIELHAGGAPVEIPLHADIAKQHVAEAYARRVPGDAIARASEHQIIAMLPAQFGLQCVAVLAGAKARVGIRGAEVDLAGDIEVRALARFGQQPITHGADHVAQTGFRGGAGPGSIGHAAHAAGSAGRMGTHRVAAHDHHVAGALYVQVGDGHAEIPAIGFVRQRKRQIPDFGGRIGPVIAAAVFTPDADGESSWYAAASVFWVCCQRGIRGQQEQGGDKQR